MFDITILPSLSLPEPYPQPAITTDNPYYATLLLEDYAGKISKTTTIHQFFYHTLTHMSKIPEIAKIFNSIIICSINHLHLIGTTISLLGLPPKLRTISNNAPIYWRTSFIYYGQNLYDCLAADIALEKSVIMQLQHHLNLIEDPLIKLLLNRIICEDEHHLELLRQIAVNYCPGLLS